MKLTAEASLHLEELTLVCKGARCVALNEWLSLDPYVLKMFPSWYRDLVSQHAVVGVSLDIETEDGRIFVIGLTEPEMLSGTKEELLNNHYAFPPLFESDYFPIGFTEDGDIFVARRALPTGVFEFQPDYDAAKGFIPGVANHPQWKDVSEFIMNLRPEDYESLNKG